MVAWWVTANPIQTAEEFFITMITATDALDALFQFTEAKRRNSLTGRLLGLGLPERDALLSGILERFDADIEAARAEAARTGKPVAVDGAPISLTDGGDTWWAHPDGTLNREYDAFPGFGDFLATLGSRPAVDFSRPVAPDVRFRAAYNGFWSPSATNWQPVRVVELDGEIRKAFMELAGWNPEAIAIPLWVLLRRDHYESLLGDVMEPFGLAVTAREESLDVGIFAQAAAVTAMSEGLTSTEHVFPSSQLAEATRLLRAELDRRLAKLGHAAEDTPAGMEIAKLTTLAAMLDAGKYLPDSLLAIGHPVEATGVTFEAFGTLIDQHSTQRVASLARDFGKAETELLWEQTVASLQPHERRCVTWTFFHRDQKTPYEIGAAMFAALYGEGADAETKAGGEGGMITSATLRNYLLEVAKRDPAYIQTILPEDWKAMSDADLQKATRQVAVRTQDVGRFLLDRILRDGKYVSENGRIQDTSGKPLSLPVLVRMGKTLASTFGNFFLKFQNTHPQNAVLLANLDCGLEEHHVFRTVGKVGFGLTYAARALAATSIIKTGPIDLAREAIAKILVSNPDNDPALAAMREAIQSGRLSPAMTFQVGYPLTGSELVDAGTPNEHTGHDERKRDKRPPRDDFRRHYLPSL
jgi:hypothetical protein